ncbi:2,3-butanediol dehydrogenase [Oceanobacillus jeddahense]|uniref:2,3-butanediol dehydrogenase n=1 Tax=Oceanobacillus jeddahense TaxID=1462527 RepID=UPI0005958789|nr:2,3-butanediol dehydrogenase [Oceanobacillus jeddahense]
MKAAVWYNKKDIRVEERELKKLDSKDVKIKVAWTGICGSDLHEYAHGPIQIPTNKPDPLTQNTAPLTMGHEFAGVVEAVGSDVTNVEAGERVTVNPSVTYRRKPDYVDVYDGYAAIGLHTDGGFADFVVVKEHNVFHLPENLSLEEGALVEPMAVGLQSVKEASLTIGETAVIIGAGPIGLLILIAAKAAGASNIIVADLSEERLKIASEIGATHIINSGEIEPVEKVRELIPGGADAVFEVAGAEPAFNQALQMAKLRGRVTIVSIIGKPIAFTPMDITKTGVTINSVFAYEFKTFKETIDLMSSGRLKPQAVVTDKIELSNIVEQGFEALSNDKSQAKILVKLSGEQ